MLFRTVFPALLSLLYVGKVAAQITTTLPWIPDDGPDGDLDDSDDDGHLASGLVVGTGTAGETTCILTMSDNDDNNRPITATFVTNASGVTVFGVYSDEDRDEDDADGPRSVSYSIGCGIQSNSAACTYERVGVIGSSMFTSATTGTALADMITLVASTGTISAQATQNGGSGSGSASGSAAASGATVTANSGARGNVAAGLFACAVPLVMAPVAIV